jgi:hypothetical protein
MCPDCYGYAGHVLFNALAPELWRRFTIYLGPRDAGPPRVTVTDQRFPDVLTTDVARARALSHHG